MRVNITLPVSALLLDMEVNPFYHQDLRAGKKFGMWTLNNNGIQYHVEQGIRNGTAMLFAQRLEACKIEENSRHFRRISLTLSKFYCSTDVGVRFRPIVPGNALLLNNMGNAGNSRIVLYPLEISAIQTP